MVTFNKTLKKIKILNNNFLDFGSNLMRKMRKIKNITCCIILLATISIKAQVSVNVNVGSKPEWAPVVASDVEYYYLPDIDSYYDIRNGQFISLNNGKWIRARNLPSRYRNYDLYKGNTVVLNDYRGKSPYTKYKFHKVKYYKGNNENHNNEGEKAEYKKHKNKGHGGKHD